jgi:hypothetical protein
MKYILAYIVGGVVALTLANEFWYPAPALHGVALGLLMGAIFISGSFVAMAITWGASTPPADRTRRRP